jgi:hypothetical protein
VRVLRPAQTPAAHQKTTLALSLSLTSRSAGSVTGSTTPLPPAPGIPGAGRGGGSARIARPLLAAFVAYVVIAPLARAGDLVVHLPDTVAVKSAAILSPPAQPGEDGPPITGKIQAHILTFHDLLPATPYDLLLTLKDGSILHGVNMAWYSRQPADPDAGPLTDDDRTQINAIASDVKSFYNISRIVTLTGDHERAVALVERIRSNDFHSDKGGEVIWRVELWYFSNEFGGWSELTQSNKVLRRERFTNNDEYRSTAAPIKWVPLLGGIVLGKTEARREIDLPADFLSLPTTQP